METLKIVIGLVTAYLISLGLGYLLALINDFHKRMWALFYIGVASYGCYFADRANHVFGFSRTVLGILAIFCFLHFLNQMYEYFQLKKEWKGFYDNKEDLERACNEGTCIDFDRYFREISREENLRRN